MNPAIDFPSLINLDVSKQNAFAYLAAQRAYPTSVTFSEKYSFGHANVFDQAIEILHSSIFNHQLASIAESFLEIIDRNAPATNDYPTYNGTVAQDCGVLFLTAIRMLIENNREAWLGDISTLLTDAVDAYVVEKNDLDYGDENFEEIIASDPLMVGEINAQNGIISYLKSKTVIDQSDIDYLLNWQKEMTVNLILDWDK